MSPCLPPGDEGVTVAAVVGRMLRSSPISEVYSS